jgi:tetratricopeptide (TPR) repeat protein
LQRLGFQKDGAYVIEPFNSHSHYAEAYLNRGLTYKSKGDKVSAIANLQIATKLTNDKSISSQADIALQELRKTATQVRVYVEFNDAGDKKVVDSFVALLSKNGYRVLAELASGKTSGDVRYYYQEDKQTAENVRGVVKDSLSAFGLKLNISSVSLVGRFPNITRGHIEVWLPQLVPAHRKRTRGVNDSVLVSLANVVSMYLRSEFRLSPCGELVQWPKTDSRD